MADTGFGATIVGWLARHRKRIATMIAMVAIGVIGGHLARNWPRDVDVRFHFGPNHGRLTEATVRYLLEGEEVKVVRFQHAEGTFPEVLDHRVELPPGRYEIEATLRGIGPTELIRRSFDVPTEGTVRLDLFQHAYARGTWVTDVGTIDEGLT